MRSPRKILLGSRGVSSTVGTVMMVAIVVLLVASVSFFAFSLASQKVTMMDRVIDSIPGM